MSDIPAPQVFEQQAWSISQWLAYLEQIHPSNIELGLARVNAVFNNLHLDFNDQTVVTVAGTNGKGTTCAFIEQALLSKNKSVAVFSSPHLIDYRERVRDQGVMLSEEAHCQAFMQVEQARGNVTLTYFEFGTLAALYLLKQSKADYLLLEVGLGGRLDAVNIVQPNIAVITSIGLDHQDWLGDTRELIAIEKAGIFRKGIPAVIGEPEPPETLMQEVERHQVQVYWQTKDFDYQINTQGFYWQGENINYQCLPQPFVPAQNVSTALKVLELLGMKFEDQSLKKVFANTQLVGRRQVIQQQPTVMLDVAHNPQATSLLASDIKNMGYKRIIAVVAMLADKDIQASLAPMQQVVTSWYCANLDVSRGASANVVASALTTDKKVVNFPSVKAAYKNVLANARQDDLIIVFGSFFTVADVLKLGGHSSIKEV